MLQRTADGSLQVTKEWTRLLRHGSLNLAGIPSRVRHHADLARIEKLGHEMQPSLQREPTSAAKYANYPRWIPFNVCRVGALSLHKAPPQRILDIGCGPGYFLAAARECGHECYGVDAPASILTDIEKRVYSELLGALSLDKNVSPLLIERYVPMSLPQTSYDLITAFWICFNRHRQPDEWSADEWQFFLNDALGHLRDGGVLHLELNANPERYGAMEFYDTKTLELFRSAGSVNRGEVRIRKVASSL